MMLCAIELGTRARVFLFVVINVKPLHFVFYYFVFIRIFVT